MKFYRYTLHEHVYIKFHSLSLLAMYKYIFFYKVNMSSMCENTITFIVRGKRRTLSFLDIVHNFTLCVYEYRSNFNSLSHILTWLRILIYNDFRNSIYIIFILKRLEDAFQNVNTNILFSIICTIWEYEYVKSNNTIIVQCLLW